MSNQQNGAADNQNNSEVKPRYRGFEVLPGFEDTVQVPKRQTYQSAGYDLTAAIESPLLVHSGEMVMIPTGLTAYMMPDEWLGIFIRGGCAAKRQFTLQNDVGVVDADYYGKHIKILLRNEGDDTIIQPGERIAQGIFQKYLMVDDDCPVDRERTGGFNHTGK